jgi:uncharacterized protein (TIGR03435 family)
LTVLGVCDVGTVDAQPSKATFEVASIRRNVTGETNRSNRAGNTYRATAVSIPTLISTVYQIRRDQLVGAPEWLETQRFDITATATAELTLDRWRLMVRTLLEERFGLVLAREQHEGDRYVLKIARRDGRLGPDLHRAVDECVNEPRDPLDIPPAARRSSTGLRPSLIGVCATIDNLAVSLSRIVQATVISQTGLAGRWNYTVAHAGVQPAATNQNEPPGLFTAVLEQLGLELERERGTIDVWVIKSIHPPIED